MIAAVAIPEQASETTEASDQYDYTHAHASPLTLASDARRDDDPPIDPGARLPAAVEVELKWALDDPLLAGVIASSGSFGAQLERAESYGFGAIPCRTCGGSWRTRRRSSDGGEYFSEWREGTGWVPSKKHFGAAAVAYPRALKLYREQQAKLLRLVVIGAGGTASGNEAAAALFGEIAPGHKLVTAQQVAELFPSIPPELCRICDKCTGIGVVPKKTHKNIEVTARPTGSSVGKAGRHPDTMVAVDLAGLARYEAVDRLLSKVAFRRPIHRIVISSYYGPKESTELASARKGRHHRAGRAGSHPTGGIESVWPLTSSAQDEFPPAERLSLDEGLSFIRNRAGLDRLSSDQEGAFLRLKHAKWLSSIQREAWALYGAACANVLDATRELSFAPVGDT